MKNKQPVFADTCLPSLWCTVVFWSIVMNRWKTGNNLSSQRCITIHNQSCTYKTYLDYNTFCCAITQLLIIKGEHHRENLITISLAPTNITMGKVSSCNWKCALKIILIDYLNLVFHCRSYSTKTEISRVGIMSAWATALTFTPTSTAATLSEWRVAVLWSMRDPTTWATSTSCAGGSTLTTSAWLVSMTASDPAVWFQWWVWYEKKAS